MSEVLRGNLVVAQSGGPTAVINSSVVGVVDEALRHSCIEEIYGSYEAIGGVLFENLIDLRREDPRTIRGLRTTPGCALGSMRLKVRDSDIPRIVEVLKAHNVRYFFYIGGNDSQITSHDVASLALQQGWEMRVIGVPKTVDNDLPETDHCPGFGSVARYTAITAREVDRDNESLKYVQVIECMGRDAGWLTGAAQLARELEGDGPHLVLLPEVRLDPQAFLERVKQTWDTYGRCVIAASEGLRDPEGDLLAASDKRDAFGNRQLGGVGQTLAANIEEKLDLQARWNKAGNIQRAAAHCMSETDSEEAYLVGLMAVRAAVAGETGKMVALVRESNNPYVCGTALVPLDAVRERTRDVPREWISEDGMSVTEEFLEYVRPLVGPIPSHARLARHFIPKLCPPYERPRK